MPWFVNWNDYRSSFEAQAGKILGQPVHVLGTADAKILPTPSLTFTNVQVGAADGKPMMTVERFAVTIELMPLLQGQIKVVSMQLVRPHLNIVADEKGAVDWFHRGPASRELDPDKVALQDVEINDGSVSYVDPHIGGALTFNHVNAVVEARALSGPWRIDGSYLDGATQVPFRVATGRVLDDGTIRVKTDISPAQWPVAVAADGVVGIGDEGLSYTGTFNLTQIVPAVDDGKNGGDNAGWRTEGSFKLTSDKLVVDKGVLSIGPPDRSYSLAGSATFDLGKKPSFEASLQARQLDLDRTLGKGPSAPIEVPKAVDELVAWIRSTALPSIPGRIDFQVPAIVVGGSIIQDVSFAAVTADKGWHIAGLNAQLPGQTVVAADGTLTTGGAIGFDGKVRLTVGQPATFAAWWRGRSEQGGGRLVAPFSVFGNAQIGAGRLSLDNMDATIGGASIVGNVSWSADKGAAGGHHLTTDLKADKIDFAQIRAIAELLAGRDPTALIVNSGGASSADSYAIKLSAGEMTIEDITLRGVAVDASLADQALVVNQFAIADLGGARLTVSKGRIDSLSDKPSGRLDARLTAKSLTGLSRIVDSIAPDSALSRWLTRAAPSLAGADITASLAAPAERAGADFAIKVDGTAGDTTLDAALSLSGKLADWRKGKADLQVTIDTPDSVVLARQAGFTVEPSAETKAAHIDLSGAGVPAEGMTAKLGGVFAGVSVDTAGTLTLPATGPATYAGTFAAAAEMLDPLMKMADIGIPGAAVGTALGLNGRIAVTGRTVDLNWQNGQVGDRQVGGGLKLTYGEDGAWAIGGDLSVDSVDLGWLASLGLGFAPVPTGDAAVPWSKAPFGEPTFSHVHGQIGVTTSELTVADGFDVANAAFDIGLGPGQVDFNLRAGTVVGGTFAGGFSIHNVGGNANVTGHLSLKDASLESLIWRRAGRPVATGALDLSANFEAIGRSPAALVQSLTGGGAITVRNGEVRYINPRAATLIIRSSDLGQQYTEKTLAEDFTRNLDGGTIRFDQTDGAFAIAAGTVRLKSLAIEADKVKTVGSASIDLNNFTLDSDWTLVLDPGDQKVEGTVPQVGIVFRGPISDPKRIIDVLQLNSYLNIRQEQRLQEILDNEESARLEKDRLSRLLRKQREDADRRVREAKQAAEAEARRQAAAVAADKALDAFHAERETAGEERAAAQLEAAHIAAARRAAAVALAARTQAQQAAADATAKAAEADKLAAAASTAADERDAALAAAKQAADAAAAAKADAAAAAKLLAAKQATEAAAKAVADKALAEKDAADSVAEDAANAAKAAAAASAKAAADLDAANKVLAKKSAAARKAADAAASALAEKQAAQAEVDQAKQAADDAEKAAEDAANAAARAGAAVSFASDVTDQAKANAEAAAAKVNAAAKAASDKSSAAIAAQALADKAAVDANTAEVANDAAQGAWQALAKAAADADRKLADLKAEARVAGDNPGADTISETIKVEEATSAADDAAKAAAAAKEKADATLVAWNAATAKQVTTRAAAKAAADESAKAADDLDAARKAADAAAAAADDAAKHLADAEAQARQASAKSAAARKAAENARTKLLAVRANAVSLAAHAKIARSAAEKAQAAKEDAQATANAADAAASAAAAKAAADQGVADAANNNAMARADTAQAADAKFMNVGVETTDAADAAKAAEDKAAKAIAASEAAAKLAGEKKDAAAAAKAAAAAAAQDSVDAAAIAERAAKAADAAEAAAKAAAAKVQTVGAADPPKADPPPRAAPRAKPSRRAPPPLRLTPNPPRTNSGPIFLLPPFTSQ